MCGNLSGKQGTNEDREVLPNNVQPEHYSVELEPNFETFKFAGKVGIDIKVNEQSNYITVNSLEIEVHDAKANGFVAKNVEYDEEKQRVTFVFDQLFEQGQKVKLEVQFTGELNDKMAGFYRSSYVEDNETKYLAVTQMEATDCRRAFPCFDEPAAKATFDIALISEQGKVCLSNMDEKLTEILDSRRKRVIFNTTPLMSTYLVAFIVGDLKYVENRDFRVPIRVYATSSEHLGQYAAEFSAKVLAFFEKEFDLPYPLPKCDLVAIPDFAAGAMENYGLITFRSVRLLIDPAKSNVNMFISVAEVVAHELAHQWFGNLVTMEFWEGLWLNEGFATWMSWHACDHYYPEWKVWEEFVSSTLQGALGLDSLRSSHPIEVPVKRAADINQIFDAVSYSKGSSVLRMISKWLGEETFIKGVSKYLKKHKWGNTKTEDLWNALSEVSGKEVSQIMGIWTKQVGFPVVHVKEEGGNIHLEQHRFLSTNDVKPEEDRVVFPVFLNMRTSSLIEDIVLDSRGKTLKSPADDFFKINANQHNFYRTLYSSDRWKKLGEAGISGKLSIEDRVGLVADASVLAKSGLASTVDFLNLVKSWSGEKESIVWREILDNLQMFKKIFIQDTEISQAMSNFIKDLVGPKFQSVGWEPAATDSSDQKKLKISLFDAAVDASYEASHKYALEKFESYVTGNTDAISADLRGRIYGAVAENGDAKIFDQLFNIYQNPSSEEEKLYLLKALGAFPHDDLLDKVFGFLLNPRIIKAQDIMFAMIGMIDNKVALEKKWNWFKENFSVLEKQLSGGNLFASVLLISASGIYTDAHKKEVEDFFREKDTKNYNLALARYLDRLTSNINFIKRDREAIKQWLISNGYLN